MIAFANDKRFGFVCVANIWRNTCTATNGGGGCLAPSSSPATASFPDFLCL